MLPCRRRVGESSGERRLPKKDPVLEFAEVEYPEYPVLNPPDWNDDGLR